MTIKDYLEKNGVKVPGEKDEKGMVTIFGAGSFDVGMGCGYNQALQEILSLPMPEPKRLTVEEVEKVLETRSFPINFSSGRKKLAQAIVKLQGGE
jgi:hypothetical protein